MFVSLKWKALAMSSVMLVTLGLLFSYQSNKQLKDLFEQQRWAVQLKNQQEVNSLLEQSFSHLLKFSDIIPLMVQYGTTKDGKQIPIQQVIDEHAQYIQINWDIEGIKLYDHLGNFIQSWEEGDIFKAPTHASARKVAKTITPESAVKCNLHCRQVITAPIMLLDGQSYIIQLIISLADTQRSFKDLTKSNIGILSLVNDGETSTGIIEKWGHSVVSMTEINLMLPLLRLASDNITFTNLKQRPHTLKEGRNFFEIQLVPAAGQDQNSSSYFVIVSDLTTDYKRINDSLNEQLRFTLATTVISGLIVVFLIWNLILRLRKHSNLLPLLCEGKFKHVRDELERGRTLRWFNDELDKLESTEMQVSTQLETMQMKIQENTERLRSLAMIDSVTQLGTRHNFFETCRGIIENDNNNDVLFGLMFLDLDNFKRVNDSLGHRYGDELLKVVGSRLSNCVRKGDLVCRLGGDEFCILGLDINDEKQTQQMADNILNALRIPVCIDTKQLLISASIGVATYPRDGNTVEELLQSADIALHEAKSRGKNKVHVFTKQMNLAARENLALESDLHNAINNKEFTLFYQPKLCLKTGDVLSAEALIRWIHPKKGMIPPGRFIPFLEDSGLILEVGEWVIQEAFQASDRWRTLVGRDIEIAVNLSYRQFLDPELFEKIEKSLDETNLPAHLIELEITESLMMEDVNIHNETLKRLKSLGVKIAIDDFGTGYSSLSYLKELAMDTLKIDRSFIKDLPHDESSKGITSAIIAMSHKLNLNVVAEGIETKEQHNFLLENSCDVGQGYLFSKPIPEEKFIELIKYWDTSPAKASSKYSNKQNKAG